MQLNFYLVVQCSGAKTTPAGVQPRCKTRFVSSDKHITLLSPSAMDTCEHLGRTNPLWIFFHLKQWTLCRHHRRTNPLWIYFNLHATRTHLEHPRRTGLYVSLMLCSEINQKSGSLPIELSAPDHVSTTLRLSQLALTNSYRFISI